MSDNVPADVPLNSQDEGVEPTGPDPGPDLDEKGEGLDERGLGSGSTPANPISPDAGLESSDSA